MANRLSSGIGGLALGLLYLILDLRGIEVPDWLFYSMLPVIGLMLLYAGFPILASAWNSSTVRKYMPFEASIIVRRKANVAAAPAPSAKQYRRGLVDFWRDGERAKQRFTKAIVAIGKTMEASNAKTAHCTAKLMEEQKKVPPSAERVHKRTTDLAQSLNHHTDRMAASGSEAGEAAQQLRANYTDFLKWQTDKDALISSRPDMMMLHDAASQFKSSMMRLRQTVLGLQKMNFAESIDEACSRLIAVITAIITTTEGVREFTTEAFRIIDEKAGSRPARRSASRRAKSRPQ